MKYCLSFYKDILCKKRFFMPVLLFSIVAYSFTIYNRTVGLDDFSREGNIGSGNRQLAGRWGMVLWNKLVGTTVALDPFIDRFLALFFLLFAAILLCYILYIISGNKRIISYTITASIFITYPLITSIWEYTGADFMLTGNLCLATLAAIVQTSRIAFWKKMFIAGSLLLLPMSSYESSIFYYISLACIVIFFEYCVGDQGCLNSWGWIKKYFLFAIPLVIAFLGRFTISFIINYIYDLEYSGGGATEIAWLHDNIFHVMKCMFAFNIVKYVLTGLVFFPIAIFVMSLFLFAIYILFQKEKRLSLFLLGVILVLSLFSQSFLQGVELEYRHAQTITLFVAFTAYLLCALCASVSRRELMWCVYIAFFALSWHQAVYLNRILGLNNLRSDNEIALIHQIGISRASESEKKPVAFVGTYPKGDFINSQICVDESVWNGKLFFKIYEKYIAKLDRPYYYGANVNTVLGYYQLRECFKYFGYDVDVVMPSLLSETDVNSRKYKKTGDHILNKARTLVKEKGIKPYQIYNADSFFLVYLGGD